MAFVNVSQVNTQKLYTMNAADAAALAGAAQLASTANSIADVNSGQDGLFESYYMRQAWTTILPFDPISASARFGLYINDSLANLLKYLGLLAAGLAASQQAAAQATMTAFGNMPIEEAQTREDSVTGDVKVPSRLSNWLQNTNFYSEDTLKEYTYEWSSHYYNITEGRQMLRPQHDFIKVKVKKPDDNCLVIVPAPASPQATFYMMYLPPCVVVDLCAGCAAVAELTTFPAGIMMRTVHPTAAAITLGTALATSTIYSAVGGVPTPVPVSQILTGLAGVIALLVGWLQPIDIYVGGCNNINIVMVLYWVPLPYLINIANNNAEVAVEVTRFSPTRDLGLWQFRERSITSGSRARMRDGSVWSANYKIEIKDVWDGQQL